MIDWIDVNERLPKDIADCLLTWDGELFDEETYYDHKKGLWMQFQRGNRQSFVSCPVEVPITHWLPFPSPPRKKKKYNKLSKLPPNCS